MPKTETIRARITEHGERRRAALETAEHELEAMRPDLVAAMEAGIPIAELSRLAAVSRPTLYDLKR